MRLLSLIIVAWGILFPCLISAAGDLDKGTRTNPYTVGIVPQFDMHDLHVIWQPILDALQERTGLYFELKGSASIPAFEKGFAEGDFDFAYMNPYHMLVANELQGYVPLVRDVGKSLYGILVVHKDSSFNDVQDLDGELVAFPAPNALGASLLMRAELERLHGVTVIPRYVRSHTSTYLNVALRETAAGGGVQKTFDQQPAEVRNMLRIIYKTREVPPHPFSAHRDVPVAIRQQVRQALLRLDQTDQGRRLFLQIPVTRLGSAGIGDYRLLKDLELEHYYVGK